MSSDQKHVETRVVATNAGTKSIDQAALFLADAEDFEPLNAEQEQRLKSLPSEVTLAYRFSSSLPLRLVPSTKSLYPQQLSMASARIIISSASNIHGSALSSLSAPLSACFPLRYLFTNFQQLSTYVAALSAGQQWHSSCQRAAALAALWRFVF
jgi:hypothetical protein